MKASIFSDDFKASPYWWERSPRPQTGSDSLPASADVVIIGSGYTGLCAAIQTAGHGRHTIVVDAQDAGWGCSSRNGGQISTSIKPTYPQLAKKYGADAAMDLLREGNHALNWVESVVRDNHIDCDFRRVGRFYGAHSKTAFAALQDRVRRIPEALNAAPRIIQPGEQHTEIGSDYYHGGVVFPHHASLDPGRYHRGLLECAISAGAEVVSHCKVGNIQTSRGQNRRESFTVTTAKGVIAARDVIVATSGYTSGVTPWQRRRIIPIGSYVIATEPLPQGLAEKLIPNQRVVTDTLKLVVYYRTCPQRKRLLFGGRVSLNETDCRVSASRLHELMVCRFPELESVKISHSWMGIVGYTFDQMPHLGQNRGIYYSMGYCGSGIALASYFGMKTGLKVVGHPHGETAFDGLAFPGRIYYRRKPWFLAPSIACYRYIDKRR